jgi:hypothetical protein
MGETSYINLSALESGLSPSSFAVFRVLYENARSIIIQEGTRELYEKPLSELMSESDSKEVEAVANSIREIVQRMIECKKGDYLLFLPFLKSISIENGIIRYSLPREIEGFIKTSG